MLKKSVPLSGGGVPSLAGVPWMTIDDDGTRYPEQAFRVTAQENGIFCIDVAFIIYTHQRYYLDYAKEHITEQNFLSDHIKESHSLLAGQERNVLVIHCIFLDGRLICNSIEETSIAISCNKFAQDIIPALVNPVTVWDEMLVSLKALAKALKKEACLTEDNLLPGLVSWIGNAAAHAVACQRGFDLQKTSYVVSNVLRKPQSVENQQQFLDSLRKRPLEHQLLIT